MILLLALCQRSITHINLPQLFDHKKYHSRMKFTVTIQQDEDGVYIAECPSIPGCLSQGATEAEAEANI